MALRMLFYVITRNGSQNVGLHENKSQLSKCLFLLVQEMVLRMLFYKRTRDGSQNVVLHENKRQLSECWFT